MNISNIDFIIQLQIDDYSEKILHQISIKEINSKKSHLKLDISGDS